ncbi:MAG: histone H1 [Alphaproteobacteria bacterium]|nr:histone H1 [Alphaproteobacteria bacterium]
MQKFDELVAAIEAAREDAGKFYNKGNNAAGTRVRKAMQDIKRLAQEIRTEIQDRKNAE